MYEPIIITKNFSLATLARQNRNNIALNNHVPDMDQWNQVYVPCSHRREVIFSLASSSNMCPPLTCYNIIKKINVGALPARQNGIEIALNTIVPAPNCNNETSFIYM